MIERLINKLNDETLERETLKISRIVEYGKVPNFTMGYCAADTQTFGQVTEYIQKVLRILPEHTLDYDLPIGTSDLVDFFRAHQEELESMSSDVLLVRVTGFEKLLQFRDRVQNNIRAAHDYDQNVVQNYLNRNLQLTKKIVVITHINPEPDKDRYERAVQSTLQSDFKSFSMEFENVHS